MRIDLDIDYSTKLIAVRHELEERPKDKVGIYLNTLAVIEMPDNFENRSPAEQVAFIASELMAEGFRPAKGGDTI